MEIKPELLRLAYLTGSLYDIDAGHVIFLEEDIPKNHSEYFYYFPGICSRDANRMKHAVQCASNCNLYRSDSVWFRDRFRSIYEHLQSDDGKWLNIDRNTLVLNPRVPYMIPELRIVSSKPLDFFAETYPIVMAQVQTILGDRINKLGPYLPTANKFKDYQHPMETYPPLQPQPQPQPLLQQIPQPQRQIQAQPGDARDPLKPQLLRLAYLTESLYDIDAGIVLFQQTQIRPHHGEYYCSELFGICSRNKQTLDLGREKIMWNRELLGLGGKIRYKFRKITRDLPSLDCGLEGIRRSVAWAVKSKSDVEACGFLYQELLNGVKAHLGQTLDKTLLGNPLNLSRFKFESQETKTQAANRPQQPQQPQQPQHIPLLQPPQPQQQLQPLKVQRLTKRRPKPSDGCDFVPKSLRFRVWCQFNGRSMDGKCFACDQPTVLEDFESGHIISKAHGGETCQENLKPVCRSCNGRGGMSTMHMYEFMLIFKLDGLKNISPTDPELRRVIEFREMVVATRLLLEELGFDAQERAQWEQRLDGRTSSIEDRLEVIKTIQQSVK